MERPEELKGTKLTAFVRAAGTITIDGVPQSLNADFAQQTLFLSRELDLSERYAASLLQSGLSGRARWGRDAAEVAVLLLHREKLALLACLKELIRGALTLPHEQDPSAQRLGAKMEQLAEALLDMQTVAPNSTGPGQKRKVSLPERILLEIDAIREQATKVQSVLRAPAVGYAGSSAQDTGLRLSDEIQLERLAWMRQERRELGHLLYLLSISRMLSQANITAIVRWLAAVKPAQLDGLIIYVLTTLLAALDTTADAQLAWQERTARGTTRIPVAQLLDDSQFIGSLNVEVTTKQWGIPELKAVVVLQWSLFLVEALRQNPSLSTELRIQEEGIERLVMGAIAGTGQGPSGLRGDAFVFLITNVLAFRKRMLDALDGEDDDVGEVEPVAALNGGDLGPNGSPKEQVDEEFQEYVLQQVQILIASLTTVMMPFLRKIQREEEDAAFASSRAGRPGATAVERRYDIEALFDLIAMLCKGRPEAGLPFWQGQDGRLTRFLTWAIDVREPGHQRALLDMLAALAAGAESSWHAHNLLSVGDDTGVGITGSGDGRLVSWARLFEWVQYYIDSFRTPQTSGPRAVVGMPPEEVVLLRAFFRLLRNVAHYSVAARGALYEHAGYSVVQRLFGLYTCPVPVDLKAAIVDALAAFAHPSGSRASQIVRDLWNLLEATQVLGVPPVQGTRMGFGSRPAPGGVILELENVEAPNHYYPGTTSFVNFLKALIHVPPRLRNSSAALTTSETTGADATGGMVLNLGQGTRAPGLEPYVSFVIDNVLLQAGSREYANPAERWRVVAACLDFLERCLMSYDLSALLVEGSGGREDALDSASLTALVLHPGFTVLKRLLTGSRLLNEVLSVLNPGGGTGFEAVNTHRAKTIFFASSVRHALRIVQRVLRVQDLFLQVLIPTLADPPSTALPLPFDAAAKVGHPSAMSPLDTHLLHAHQSVVQIALFINCNRDDIALLSVRVLGLLARSPAFSAADRFGEMGYRRKMNRLVGLLEMSDEADRVRAGFVDRLEAEGDATGADTLASKALLLLAEEEDTSAGQVDPEAMVAPAADATEAIRLASLDLLLANTASNQPAPNIAHLLLGFDLRTTRAEEQVLPDPDAPDVAPSCLHAILALLRPQESTLGLAERAPALAEKCCALVARLCTHPFTSAATLRYLRTREDFFVRQLQTLPYIPVERKVGHGSIGTVVFPDGRSMVSSVDALVASLRMRACLLDTSALELHTLTNAGQLQRAARLIAAFFGANVAIGAFDLGEDEEEDDSTRFIPNGEYDSRLEQSGIRLLELLQSFDFEWHDARDEADVALELLANLDVAQARRPDADAGPRVYDLDAVTSLLMAARRGLQRSGVLVDAGQRAKFEREAEAVLQYVAAQNAHRAIAHARRSALQAWRAVLQVSLIHAHLLRPDARSGVFFDCLAALLPRLAGPAPEADPALADLVAGSVLALLTALRQQRVGSAAAASQFESPDSLPTDRLIATLRALVAAMLRPGTTPMCRANLGAALSSFLQLTCAPSEDAAPVEDTASAAFSAAENDDIVSLSSFGGGSITLGTQGTAVEGRTRALLAAHAERLVPIIARDALDAADVCRAVALTLLDKLATLDSVPAGGAAKAAAPSRAPRVLELLGRQGLLQSFVAGVRDMDVALQDVLRPDPASLNALYIFESQLAFFNRLAQTREGAERLLDARVFEVLAQADYIAARPEQDQDFVDLDSFLPAATERYHALMLPTLQLCVSVLASASTRAPTSFYGTNKGPSSSNAAPRQALVLLSAHREALLALLKTPTNDICSLTQLELAHLVVSLLDFVLPTLDDDALIPPAPFAPFHTAVLALAAPFLAASGWRTRVLPHSDAEREEARHPVRSPNNAAEESQSVFDVKAGALVDRLGTALLAYLEAATDTRGRPSARIRPVFTPNLSVPRERTPRYQTAGLDDGFDDRATFGRSMPASMAVPSIGTAIAALDERVEALAIDFERLEHVGLLLADIDTVRIEEWDEVSAAPYGLFLITIHVGQLT